MSASILAKLTALEDELRHSRSSGDTTGKSTFQKYLQDREPVCTRRYELVNGTSSPSPEEIEDFDLKQYGEQAEDGNVDDEMKESGLPSFWATVLRNQDFISDHITERDQAAIQHLQDIRLIQGAGQGGVEFHFGPNPFFENNVLRRVVGWDDSGQGSFPVEEGTDIQWKAGQNLTIKESSKKTGKKGGKPRVKPCPSFFRFFFAAVRPSSGNASLGEDEDEDTEEMDSKAMDKFDLDETLIKIIKDKVIPKAVHLYLSGSLKSATVDSEEEYEVVSGQASPESALSLHGKKIMHALKKGQHSLDSLHEEMLSKLKNIHLEWVQKVKNGGIQRKKLLMSSDGSSLEVFGFYWHTLRAVSLGPLAIHGRDEKALTFLCDIRYDLALIGGEEEGFKEIYELEFLENPYFQNKVLRREFEFKGSILEMQAARLVSDERTTVDWKPGMDLTLKVAPTKGTSQGKPASSFFGLFKPGNARFTFNILGEGRDAAKEAEELEVEFFQQIRDEVITNPAGLFTEMDALGEEGDESEISDAGEREDRKKSIRGPEMQIRRSWTDIKFSTANIVVGIVILLVLVEVVVYWDQIANSTGFYG